MVNQKSFRYLIIAPAVFLILLVGLYPLIKLLVTSMQNITMFEEDYSFQGMTHFLRLGSDSRLWESILHTVLFWIVALPIELLFGLAMALLFLDRLYLKQLFIALLVLPPVISPIVAGSIWKLMLDHRFGPVNQTISWLVGSEVKLLWTTDSDLVWFAILIAEVWQWTPFMFLLLLASLSNVDQEQLDAAAIDGASGWKMLTHIMLPAITPVIGIAVLIRSLDLIRVFDVIWTMTQGGPGTLTETISIYTYQMAFREFEVSYSSAIAFLVILLLTFGVILSLNLVKLKNEKMG